MISSDSKHTSQLIWTACVAIAVALVGLHQSLGQRESEPLTAAETASAPALELRADAVRRSPAAKPAGRISRALAVAPVTGPRR